MKSMKHLSAHSPLVVIALLIATTLALSACDDDDGMRINGNKVSDIIGEFGMLTTNSSALTVGFLTDNDKYIEFYEPMNVSGAVADTTYRALVYYYTFADVADTYGLYAFSLVNVCEPKDINDFGDIKNDPVLYPEIWVSNNGSYINITINVLTDSSDSPHEFDIVRSIDPDKGYMTTLTLHHDQNDIAQYYTATTYMSIPIKGYFTSGEPVNIVINTMEEGVKETIITIP